MIVVSGEFEIEAADREAGLAAAVRMATETRKEAGCQSYAFYADVEEPARIRVFEEWESGEALELHFKTPHMAEFRAALGRIKMVRGAVWRYEVAERTKLG
jgi:quinol monooxygenase YgiN